MHYSQTIIQCTDKQQADVDTVIYYPCILPYVSCSCLQILFHKSGSERVLSDKMVG